MSVDSEMVYWTAKSEEKERLSVSQQRRIAIQKGALSSYAAMEFLAQQVNAGRAVLFSPRLQDSAAFPYEVFIDNRLWMGDSLAEAISKAAHDMENETEEGT